MNARFLRFAAALAAVFYGCDLSDAPGGGTGVDGLAGLVVDGRGTPVAGARVRVYPAPAALAKGQVAPPPQADSTFTGADGRYRFTKLPHGRYNLQIDARIRDTAYASFVPGFVHDRRRDLKADTLRPTGSLSVKARDGSGPAAGATCVIPGSGWRAVADSSGTCLFAELAPGSFRVTVISGALQAVSGSVQVESGALATAGTVQLGEVSGAPVEVPAGWIHVSAQGYDFWIPPTLALKSEGGAGEEWSALYEGGGLQLSIMSSTMIDLLIVHGYPEYRQDSVEVETGVRLLIESWRMPEVSATRNYGAHLSPGTWYFQLLGATAEDRETAVLILRTVRKWNGSGQIPLSKPAAPSLAFPKSGDTVTVDSVLRWYNTKPTLVSSYRVQVFMDTAGTPLREEEVVPDLISKVFNVDFSGTRLGLSPGTYFWRVVAVGRGGSTPSAWRRFNVSAFKLASLGGYRFVLPSDWDVSDSSRYEDGIPYEHQEARAERAWLRYVSTDPEAKPDLSAKQNKTIREIAWFTADMHAMLTEYTDPQEPGIGYRARVDFWLDSEDSAAVDGRVEVPDTWMEAGASTAAGLEELLAALNTVHARPQTNTTLTPAPRTLIAPANGATDVSRTPKVSWVRLTSMDFAAKFRVQVFEDGPAPKLVADDSTTYNASIDGDNHAWTLKALKPGTTYHWRVLATGSNYPTDTRLRWSSSELRTFTTTASP